MQSNVRGFRYAMATAILLVSASAAAIANQSSTLTPEPATPLCYCHCAYESGSKHCTKMCELPQFQSRWWAVSCRKKNPTASETSSPATTPGSRKTNRKEEAKL